MLYCLEPEVAGELGKNTEIKNFESVRLKGESPQVTHLHYQFTGWLGDSILECTPCFIVTDNLAKAIKESNLNGYEFEEMYPNTKLPSFKRILPQGLVEIVGENYKGWSGHDFCISQKSYLVITEKALNILKDYKLDYCDITELESI